MIITRSATEKFFQKAKNLELSILFRSFIAGYYALLQIGIQKIDNLGVEA